MGNGEEKPQSEEFFKGVNLLSDGMEFTFIILVAQEKSVI
jgi:hypothetical protein